MARRAVAVSAGKMDSCCRYSEIMRFFYFRAEVTAQLCSCQCYMCKIPCTRVKYAVILSPISIPF